jgi:hypothetical protein
MTKTEYKHIVPNEGPPFHGYRNRNDSERENKAQFDVHQELADEFANELNSLAALIRAHNAALTEG